MADIYKNSREAGAEVRGIGQGKDYEPGAIYRGLTGRDYEPGDVYKYGTPSQRTAIAAPTAPGGSNAGQYDQFNASLAEAQAAQDAPPPPAEVGFTDSVAKGFKGLMVTWDFLANELAQATGIDAANTEAILAKSVSEYQQKASDPRIGEMVKRGNEAEGWFEAGKSMLGYAIDNPGLIVNFLGEQVPAVVASLPVGGVGGGIANAAVARTALSVGTQKAVTMGATGAAINSSAVVLQSLGTNYVEGLDKFGGDKERAKDYATTKTLNEVPANAVAGAFLGVNPFSRLAGSAPVTSAVGNVGFQTAVQGAGGGTGAYMAAQSVGEEAGKGEILAEIFGEGVLAPIDLASASRDAKRGVTPPPTPNQPAPTNDFSNAPSVEIKGVGTNPGEIVQDQDTSRLSQDEFQSAVESPAFMAAMYSRADDDTRARLQAANPNLDLQALVQDANLVMDGFKMADNGTGPEFVSMFNDAISQFQPAQPTAPAQAQAQSAPAPFEGGTTVGEGPRDFVPVREKMRMAQELATEGQMYATGELITRDQAEAQKQPVTPTGEEKVEPTSQPGPLTQLTQAEAQIQSRFGLPSTINVADTAYVVEVGPTNKKRKDQSPVDAFVSHKGKVIKIDGQAIVNSYDKKPWTAPKVEGVQALPGDAFVSPDQWLDFVFKHETAHISNKKQPGESTGAYENRINQIALTEVKGQEYADSIYTKPQEPVSVGTRVRELQEQAVQISEEINSLPDDTPVETFNQLDAKRRELREEAKRIGDERRAEVAAETKPVEPAAEPKAEAKPKKEMTAAAAFKKNNKNNKNLRIKFSDIANETTTNKVPEAAPKPAPEQKREVQPKREEPTPVEPKAEAQPVQQDTPVPVQERTRVAEKPADFVGPNRDRLYQEADEKLDLTEKILEKYPFKMQEKMIDRIKRMDIDKVRELWGKVSGWRTPEKPRFEQAPNQFDDDTGGVMSNMARSGSMGLDAIAELNNKERGEAARRAQLEEEVRQSTKAMNTRAKAAAQTITDPELRELADSQQQEISGTTVDGFINPLGTVGVKPEFTSVEEVTQAELDAVEAQVDQQAIALQIADAIAKGEITLGDAKERARAEGIGTYTLVNALRSQGIDPTPAEINQSGAIAANHTLNSFIRESGYTEYQAREMWLRSYDNLRDKGAVELTKTEQAAYDNWTANRTKYKARLSREVQENAEYNGATLEEVFPNVLFTQFNLSEMRDTSTIEEPMRSVIRDVFKDPAAAWFGDIASVLSLRPDFEGQVNEILTKEEKAAYQEYRNSELRGAFRNAEMIVKSPAYSQLNQLRFLSPEMFADYQAKIHVAEQRQLAQILHEAAEMNDRAKAAIEAGASPENTIDAQMREYMLRDEAQSKNLDEFEDDGSDGTALYKRGYHSGAVTALTVQEHLTNQFANWETKPEYTVAQNVNQLPMDVRARLTERLQEGAFKGALDPKTGHIYLFSDFMENVADAEFTMFHELYGHWGVRAFLGDKVDAFLENQYKLNKRVAEAADRIRTEASDQGMPMGRLESIEEAISDIAASGDTSLFRQILGQLKAWLKSNGFEGVAQWIDKSGEGELAFILKQAKRAARGQGQSPMNGAPSAVRYAASKLPVELFATRDGKTTGYARQNPITGYWTVFKIFDLGPNNSNIDDLGIQTVEDYAQALQFLKKVGDVVRAKDRPTRLDIEKKFVTIPDKRQMVNEDKKTAARRIARQIQMKAQNKYLPVFEVAEFMKSKGVQTDLINRLKLLEGKTKYFVDNFEVKYEVPIVRALKEIGKKGGTVDDIDLYLIARHAKERNKVVEDLTGGQNKTGSGMGAKPRTLANGDVIPGYIDVLRDSANAPYAAELAEIGRLMDELSRDKANYMLDHAQIDQRAYESISQYEHYVTLSGNETEMEFVDTEALGGRAMNLRGNDAKRALGRGTLPVDVLQNTMNSYLSTVIRGQKNEVGQAVFLMHEQADDATFAVIEEIKTTKQLNTERLIADKAILKVIGDAPTEVAGKQFLESLAFQVADGQLEPGTAMQQLRERIREAEARRDIEPAAADQAINRINEEQVIAGRLSPNGYVTEVEQELMNQPNVFVAKFDGKPYKIVFKEKGMEFIESLSGTTKGARSTTLEAIGAWTRFFSQLVTSWNPGWILINGMRDFQTVLTNMATDPRVGLGMANQMKKQWMQSFVTSFKYQIAMQGIKSDGYYGKLLSTMAERHPISEAEAALFEEFRENGSETFFLDRKNTEMTLEKMNRHLNPKKGIWEWTKEGASAVGDFVELLSLPMETAPRFAVYKVLRQNGFSKQDAAVYAKEVSVNFNMQGSAAWIRSLFVFANPTIQGNMRLYQDYSRSKEGAGRFMPSNRFSAVMGSWIMLGVLSNFIARAIGGEDDDLEGMDKLDQIPHHKRSTSFIIAPGVPGGAIPIAYGANVYYTLGHYMADVWTGKMEVAQAAMRVAKTAFDSFSPIGSGVDSGSAGGTIAKTLSPTVGVPIIELAMNENRFGAPIYKDNKMSDVTEGDAYMNFDSANLLSTSLFRSLNKATGGTRYNGKGIDINPATFDHLVGSYLPGVITDAYRTTDLIARKAKGLDTKEAPLPVIDRLTAKIPEQWDAGAMRSAKGIVDTRFKELTAPDTTEARKKEILKEHPTIGNAKAVLQSTDQQIKTMRRNLEAIERDPKNSDEMKVEARNYYKDLEKKVIHRAVEATLKAGFKKELLAD